PIHHRSGEETAGALAVHDERQPGGGVGGVHGGRVVGHVAHPAGAVPLDARPLGIPRLAGRVGRGAVVHDATVERPAPGPVGVQPQAGRVVALRVPDAVTPLGEVCGRAALGGRRRLVGVAARVDPVTGCGRSVVLQVGEGGQPLAAGQVTAVDLLGDLI